MTKKSIIVLLLVVTVSVSTKDVSAQYLRARVGTEFPMQYWLGLNYQQGKWVSFDMSYGIVTSPYNNELYDVITVPQDEQAKKEFLQETTEDGWVVDLGANFHYKKWYIGVFGQYIQLNSAASYSYILTSDYVTNEITEQEKSVIQQYLNSPLALFVNFEEEVKLQTNLYQMGLKIGRRFTFKNPRWDVRIELGMSKNMSATTSSTYNAGLVQQILDAEQSLTGGSNNLGERLDIEERTEEINSFFHKYGNIPTLDFALTYQLFVPKKDKLEAPAE